MRTRYQSQAAVCRERRIFAAVPRFGAVAMGDTELHESVGRALQELRPALAMDGGDVELVAVDARGVVQVRLLGACCGCPMAEATLVGFIEARVRMRVPAVTRVVRV